MLTVTRSKALIGKMLAVAVVLALPLLMMPSMVKATPLEEYSKTEWFVNDTIQKIKLDIEWAEQPDGSWRYSYSFDNTDTSGWTISIFTLGYGRDMDGNIVRPDSDDFGWLALVSGEERTGVFMNKPDAGSLWVVVPGGLAPGQTLRSFYIDYDEYVYHSEISMLGYGGKVIDYPREELPIPEPTTLILLGTGALALGMALRRKQKTF